MIAFLQGKLAGKTEERAYLNVGGIGYAIGMSTHALSSLPAIGETVLIYTYLQVREDNLSLFGFLSEEEKMLFEHLISVSGVGPKVALAALSSYKPNDLIAAIAGQDVGLVTSIPGIGKKTASRIILELKDKLKTIVLSEASTESSHTEVQLNMFVREALLSMGFSSEETQRGLEGAPADASESELLQFALRKLAD